MRGRRFDSDRRPRSVCLRFFVSSPPVYGRGLIFNLFCLKIDTRENFVNGILFIDFRKGIYP